MLRGVRRALKPGGRIYLSMSGGGTAAVVLSAIDELAEHQPWRAWLAEVPVPWYFFGSEEYRLWLQDVGFLSQRVALVPQPMRQSGVAGLEGWLRTAWMPYTERVPLEHQAPFAAELARLVLEPCPASAGGSVLLPMVKLEVEALKPMVDRAQARSRCTGCGSPKLELSDSDPAPCR